MLDLAIVIVNYRSWPKLEGCLSSLDHQKEKAEKVIVVDNRSDDGVLESFMEKFPWVEWIKNDTNAGFAAACNLGAKISQTDGCCFLIPIRDCPKTVCRL